jgi:transcriptional regulator with XRE-family HTH domain
MRRMRIRTMHDLSNAARGRRIELGLSQAELAARAEVSRDWVNSFERGKRTVELALVFRLFDVLGIGAEVMDATAVSESPGDASSGLASLLAEYYER